MENVTPLLQAISERDMNGTAQCPYVNKFAVFYV